MSTAIPNMWLSDSSDHNGPLFAIQFLMQLVKDKRASSRLVVSRFIWILTAVNWILLIK